ncbi:ABC transporter permease [Palleronia sp.]|uniref:ABC transporter permease n=1 Tax=Palleronia sp. TaxID=1940284 RepID=UPI0035C78F30
MTARHALRSFRGITRREVLRFSRQRGRLLSSVVRPMLWLIVFGAGFHGILGVSIVPPYETYVTYREYMVPGLICIILLFNGMLSSLSLVYDREMGMMRVLLTAPLPRWWLLFSKLAAGTLLSVILAYVFLGAAWAFDARIPPAGWLTILPAVLLAGLMLGAIGLMLSVHVRQMENFAGAMNFVIFPMFFISSALFPLWKLQEAGSLWLWWIARVNPFTHAVELIRFAAYGRLASVSLAVVAGVGLGAFLVAVAGYDPGRSLLRPRRAAP